jgi:hypothetical protein
MRFTTTLLVLAACVSQPAYAADDTSAKAEALLQEALTNRNPDTRKTAVAALSLAASRRPTCRG